MVIAFRVNRDLLYVKPMKIKILMVFAVCVAGLKSIAKMLDVEIRVPRRKITVLLMGNHSAGKSSFINW